MILAFSRIKHDYFYVIDLFSTQFVAEGKDFTDSVNCLLSFILGVN